MSTAHSGDGVIPAIAMLNPVQGSILDWFRTHQRDLPWRRTRDPYRILVSEVMLQQTQVDRVLPKYDAFLERFPTIQDLAAAPASEVIRLWSGLGYNRRAVNLQRAAQAVVEQHAGMFPRSVDELQGLPGIGPYTAGAIACFAFEQDVGFLDTNIKRVLHRIFLGPEVPEARATQRQMTALAGFAVPSGIGWEWNQALIEFGALQCTSRKPACLTCPVQTHCVAFPEIQTALADAYRDGYRRKNEQTFEGSNRYYRGRVIAALREHPGEEGVDVSTLGPRIREDYAAEHTGWLDDVINELARDGLLEVDEEAPGYDAGKRTPRRIRLPGHRDPSGSGY